MMLAVAHIYLLGQLVDLLPTWGWYALFGVGMAVPAVGLVVSLAIKDFSPWKRSAVVAFYVLSIPLAWLVFLVRTETPLSVCSFICLMPMGMILGFVLIGVRGPVVAQRGFEVQVRREGEKSGETPSE